MITASFTTRNGKIQKFRVSGHSGYAESGSDIVCAAVSAMVMLTVNTVTDDFGIPAAVKVEEEDAVIELLLKTEDERAHALIAGLMREISALAHDFPDNVRVIVK